MYPGYQRFFLACGNWVVTTKNWPNQTRHVKSLLHLGEGKWTWMEMFVCKNMIKESRAVGPLLPCIFQILNKVNNVIRVHGMSSKPSWGVLLGILCRVVLPSSLNPDPTVSDHKMSFSTPVFVYSQLLLVIPVINKNCCIVNLLNIPQRSYCQVEYH